MKIRSALCLICCTLSIALLSCTAINPSGGDPAPPLHFDTVLVPPFKVEPLPPELASRGGNEHGLETQLAEEATAQAKRSLVQHGLAAVAEGRPSLGTSAPVLVGTLRLHLSQAPEIHGETDESRRNVLTTVTLKLVDAAGRTLREGRMTLPGRDVRGLPGAPTFNRPASQALIQAIRETVDHAVGHLQSPSREPS